MTPRQLAYLSATVTISVATVFTAAGSWEELLTTSGIGALLLNTATVVANYFAPNPRNGKGSTP